MGLSVPSRFRSSALQNDHRVIRNNGSGPSSNRTHARIDSPPRSTHRSKEPPFALLGWFWAWQALCDSADVRTQRTASRSPGRYAMLHTPSTQPRVHWWLLAVAFAALVITVVVGMLEIIPAQSPSPSVLGAFVSGAIMVVALVVFISCIMLVLGEFLRSEEFAERAYVRAGQGGAHAAGPFVVSRTAPGTAAPRTPTQAPTP